VIQWLLILLIKIVFQGGKMSERRKSLITAAWVSGIRGVAVFYTVDTLCVLKEGNRIPDYVILPSEIYMYKELVEGPDFVKMASVGLTLPVIEAVLQREVKKQTAERFALLSIKLPMGSADQLLAMAVLNEIIRTDAMLGNFMSLDHPDAMEIIGLIQAVRNGGFRRVEAHEFFGRPT
jgi:hypothetical protein